MLLYQGLPRLGNQAELLGGAIYIPKVDSSSGSETTFLTQCRHVAYDPTTEVDTTEQSTRRAISRHGTRDYSRLTILSSVRIHNVDCCIGRQSCRQKLVSSPTLLLDEVRHQQTIARITAVLDSHRGVVRSVTPRVPQPLERLSVLYTDIIGQSLPCPLRHQKRLMPRCSTAMSECARRRDISPVHDLASVEIGAGQEGVASEIGRIRNAPGVGMQEKEQSLPPSRVCDVEPVVVPLRFKRGSL